VLVNERVTGEIGIGLVVLLGVAKGDTSGSARYLAEKTATVRIFADKAGKMNLSLRDIRAGPRCRNSPYGDTRGRDGQVKAAPPDEANRSTKRPPAAPSRRARADWHFPNDDVRS
jgi:D-tyrosyl-tRNA(Tyr) deacylase